MPEAIKIGQYYDATYGTLWKDGTYFPRGTRVLVVGMHVEQGFCVRFPAELDGEPLEIQHHGSPVTVGSEPIQLDIPPIQKRPTPSQPPGRKPARRRPPR